MQAQAVGRTVGHGRMVHARIGRTHVAARIGGTPVFESTCEHQQKLVALMRVLRDRLARRDTQQAQFVGARRAELQRRLFHTAHDAPPDKCVDRGARIGADGCGQQPNRRACGSCGRDCWARINACQHARQRVGCQVGRALLFEHNAAHGRQPRIGGARGCGQRQMRLDEHRHRLGRCARSVVE